MMCTQSGAVIYGSEKQEACCKKLVPCKIFPVVIFPEL
jgi:hypothetical protein